MLTWVSKDDLNCGTRLLYKMRRWEEFDLKIYYHWDKTKFDKRIGLFGLGSKG